MFRILGLISSALAFAVFAAEQPVEVDPNTRTHGGADVRGSDAAAGGQSDNKSQEQAPRIEKETSEKDKPISARKPREEREPQEADKGTTASPQ